MNENNLKPCPLCVKNDELLKLLEEVYEKWAMYLKSDNMGHEGDNLMKIEMWTAIKIVIENHKEYEEYVRRP